MAPGKDLFQNAGRQIVCIIREVADRADAPRVASSPNLPGAPVKARGLGNKRLWSGQFSRATPVLCFRS